MTVTNITDFRANAKAYIDAIINDNGTLFINRGKRPIFRLDVDLI